MSKYAVLPVKFFTVVILCVVLSMSMLMGAFAATSESNQLFGGQRNAIVEPSQYRITVPGNITPFRTDVDSRWVFRFDGSDGNTLESVLLADILPVAKDMESFYGDWAETTEQLSGKAHAEYGKQLKSIRFDHIPADKGLGIYVMQMELREGSQRLEATVCWRFEQSYCIEIYGFNDGDMPGMDALTKQVAKSFQDFTSSSKMALNSGFFTPGNIIERLSGETYWNFPEESDEAMRLRRSGNTHSFNGDQQAAVKDYTAALQFDPDNYAIYHQIAVAYQNADMLREALSNYSKAIQLNPECALYYAARSGCYQSSQELQRSLADIDKAIELDPGNFYYYATRAHIYIEMGKYQKAVDDGNQAVRRNPYYAFSYYVRGLSSYYLGAYEEALESFQRAAELQPDLAGRYDCVGDALRAMKRYREAIVEYDKAIKLDPDEGVFYHHRASAYFYLGENEKAIEDFTKSIEVGTDNAAARGSISLALTRLERYQEAVSESNRAIKLEQQQDPAPDKANLASYYEGRANAYYGLLEDDKALADFATAIKLDPTVSYYYNNRALVYTRQGKHAQALAEYTMSLRYADDPVVYANRGNEYMTIGRYEEAISDYTNAIKLDPHNEIYYYQRSMAYYYLEEYEKAQADELKAYGLD